MWRRSAMGSQSTRGAAFDEHFTAARFKQAVDELERGGFSGAAAAEQHQRFAARDVRLTPVQQRLADRRDRVMPASRNSMTATGRVWSLIAVLVGKNLHSEELADVVETRVPASLR